MRKIMSYFFSMLFVFMALLIVDVAVLAIISERQGRRGIQRLSVESISDQIVYEDGAYKEDPLVQELLESYSSFAMIIDDEGDVIWQCNKPADLPDHYGIKDVATFSHWYLNDYPVYTWIRDEGILVVGSPKNSIWKYSINIKMKILNGLISVLPFMIIANILILIVLPMIITRKWIRGREKSRTEWIAGVSHDIRTPLSIVMGSVEKGSVVEKQCFRIRDLIGNLNTENKLDSGTGKWNEESLKLVPLLRDIICDYINSYEESFSFELDTDDKLEEYTINADSTLVRRMIENLITNSIAHNENGCNVKVSLKEDNKGKVVLIIEDDGCGCGAEKLKALNAKLKSDYLTEHGLGIRVALQVAKKYRYRMRFYSEEDKYFRSEVRM